MSDDDILSVSEQDAINIINGFYIDEPCRICGQPIMADDIVTAKYAGYSKKFVGSRLMHRRCYEGAADAADEIAKWRNRNVTWQPSKENPPTVEGRYLVVDRQEPFLFVNVETWRNGHWIGNGLAMWPYYWPVILPDVDFPFPNHVKDAYTKGLEAKE